MFKTDPTTMKTKYFPARSKIFLDLETSGFEPSQGAVILSMAFIYQKHTGDVPNKEDEVEEILIDILPTKEEWEKASPGALKVNGMTWEYLTEHGVPLAEAKYQLARWLTHKVGVADDSFLVGQNPKFDLKFLRSFIGNELTFIGFPWSDIVDNINLFKQLKQLDTSIKSPDNKGHSISAAIGVDAEDVVHTALGGAQVVYRNYWGIHSRIGLVIESLRNDALEGVNGQAILLPIESSNFKAWVKAATGTLGWEQIPNNPHQFVDPDGTRWSYIAGTPPILFNLSNY